DVGLVRKNQLAAGPDGRSRYEFIPFGSSSGRNTWKGKTFIGAQPKFIRGMIQPAPGRGGALLDYVAQEGATSGAMSGDRALLATYAAKDISLDFGYKTDLIPAGTSGQALETLRKKLKIALLSIQYGATVFGLSANLGVSTDDAQLILDAHQRAYPALH